MKWPKTPHCLLLALICAPVACDTLSPPIGGPIPLDDGAGTGGFELFCPTATFPLASPSAALVGPLFAWVTEEERLAIEAGGDVLPPLPIGQIRPVEQLPAAVHAALSSWMLLDPPFFGQPRVGRSFWPLAFAAPRTSPQSQLLAIWLRPDAWFSNLHGGGFDLAAIDASSNGVLLDSVLLSPGRLAGVDTLTLASCLREGAPERGMVIIREEAIERVRFGPEAEDRLDLELFPLEEMLQQVRLESHLNPTSAFDFMECGSTFSSHSMCSEDTYVPALAWTSPRYLPTISALSSLIDEFRSLPKTAAFAADRTTPEELAAWAAVWPGPWGTSYGSGGTSSGGTTGSGGTSSGGSTSSGGTSSGGAGGLGGSEG